MSGRASARHAAAITRAVRESARDAEAAAEATAEATRRRGCRRRRERSWLARGREALGEREAEPAAAADTRESKRQKARPARAILQPWQPGPSTSDPRLHAKARVSLRSRSHRGGSRPSRKAISRPKSRSLIRRRRREWVRRSGDRGWKCVKADDPPGEPEQQPARSRPSSRATEEPSGSRGPLGMEAGEPASSKIRARSSSIAVITPTSPAAGTEKPEEPGTGEEGGKTKSSYHESTPLREPKGKVPPQQSPLEGGQSKRRSRDQAGAAERTSGTPAAENMEGSPARPSGRQWTAPLFRRWSRSRGYDSGAVSAKAYRASS